MIGDLVEWKLSLIKARVSYRNEVDCYEKQKTIFISNNCDYYWNYFSLSLVAGQYCFFYYFSRDGVWFVLWAERKKDLFKLSFSFCYIALFCYCGHADNQECKIINILVIRCINFVPYERKSFVHKWGGLLWKM